MTWIAPVLLWAPTLFDQSVVRILQRNFPAAQFLLVDVDTREVLGARWQDPDRPIPFGSITKPFLQVTPGTALCDPSQCWLPQGHGSIGYTDAIAQSCNSYFLQKATGRIRYDLPQPTSYKPATLIGLGLNWRISPTQIALAYAALARDPSASQIRQGMRAGAQHGTAKRLAIDALAKTGTAPCSHTKKAPGDGYVAILYPPQVPRYVLLVQLHGVSGAVAAKTAGEMLTVLRDGK